MPKLSPSGRVGDLTELLRACLVELRVPEERAAAFRRKPPRCGGSATRSPACASPPEEHIAVFDNGGTLWCEQPAYVQAAFVADRLRALAPSHPEWKTEQPYAAALADDLKTVPAGGETASFRLVMATHAGMTTDQFAKIVADWIAEARHPRCKRPYTELVYQPTLELLAYLGVNGFRTYIVSGGGVEFIRPWPERVYGFPPEQVIGSTIKTSLRLVDGKPVLMREPAIDAVDDGPGKPVAINRVIGRRPIFAAGNSDGDLQMQQWTTRADGLRFGLLVHHTDAAREYAHDRQSHVGRLEGADSRSRRRLDGGRHATRGCLGYPRADRAGQGYRDPNRSSHLRSRTCRPLRNSFCLATPVGSR